MKNQVKIEDFYKYINNIFNIKDESILVNINIKTSIKQLPDPVEFINFAQEQIGNTKYQYMSGYQKFLRVFGDFKQLLINNLSEKDTHILNNYISQTVNKIEKIFDEIHYQLQITGKNFIFLNLQKTFENNLKDKQILMCKNAGNWQKLYVLYLQSPQSLRDLIYQSAFNLAIIKRYPSLKITKKSNDAKMIEKLEKKN